MIRLVGEAAPGEDDYEHGRHSDDAAGDQEPKLGRSGDELARKPIDCWDAPK